MCAFLQTFVKGYLITLVRLLLGIDAEENSGHLSSVSLSMFISIHFNNCYNHFIYTHGSAARIQTAFSSLLSLFLQNSKENKDIFAN